MQNKKMDSKIDDVASKSSEVARKAEVVVGGTAKKLGERVEEATEKASHGVQEIAGRAANGAHEITQKVAHAAAETATKAEHRGHALVDKLGDTLKGR